MNEAYRETRLASAWQSAPDEKIAQSGWFLYPVQPDIWPLTGGSEPDMNILLLGYGEHLLEAFLASDAGLFETAEGRAKKVLAGIVYPDVARLHGHCGAMRGIEIIGPARACQPAVLPWWIFPNRWCR